MRLAALKIHQGTAPAPGATVQLAPLARSRKGKAARDGRVRRSAAPISATKSRAAVLAASSKIGRASCRERVCQYVWISVGAVYLKKQTKKKYRIKTEKRY